MRVRGKISRVPVLLQGDVGSFAFGRGEKQQGEKGKSDTSPTVEFPVYVRQRDFSLLRGEHFARLFGIDKKVRLEELLDKDNLRSLSALGSFSALFRFEKKERRIRGGAVTPSRFLSSVSFLSSLRAGRTVNRIPGRG